MFLFSGVSTDLTKKKNIKVLFFPLIAALFWTAPHKKAAADSFLNPSDNAYSLKKVFARPFLQSVPVPQVWQTDSKSEKFRRAWLNALTPRTPAERQSDALFWQTDAQDSLYDFEKTAKDNPAEDWGAVARILNDLVNIVGLAENNAVFGSDRQDDLYMRSQIRRAERETDMLAGGLSDLQAFLASLNETARTDMELARLDALMHAADRKTDQVFAAIGRSLLSENVLKKAQDIYSPETQQIQGLKETDDVLASLLVNDMMDLSTGVVMLSGDDMLPDQPVERTRRSSSLLDRVKKTDQIHKSDPVSRRKAFFKRLENFLKGDKAKDVK